MTRALIIGVSGFVGKHLLPYLFDKNIEVAGTYHRSDNLLLKNVKLFKCNILDRQEVNNVIMKYRPDYIFHLAGPSYVADSWDKEERIFEEINFGTRNVLQAAINHVPNSTVLYVSSADVYGDFSPEAIPLMESVNPRPTNPYGYSKACSELLCLEYFYKYNLNVIIARPFNHTGPGQKESFFCPALAKQIAKILSGFSEPNIIMGNLEVERDFLDVKDVVAAYYMLMTSGRAGNIYNICSGKTIKLKDVLETMLIKTKLLSKVTIEVDPSKIRLGEQMQICGSYEKIRNEIGWEPSIPFDSTLGSLLVFWREKYELL